jgi:hypothetical protein
MQSEWETGFYAAAIVAPPRMLRIAGAERKVLRSGSVAGKEFASFMIVSRLSDRWYSASSLLPVRA